MELFLVIYIYDIYERKDILSLNYFSFMWGGVCIYTALILNGYGQHLFLKEYYVFHHMDTYMIYFTIVMLGGFYLAHSLKKHTYVNVSLMMNSNFINKILSKYKWIMWLNFLEES